MNKSRTIFVKAEIFTPRIPNFLKQTDGTMLPIEAIADSGLRKIGEAFTEELIEKAQKRRVKEKVQNDPK